MIKYRYPYCHKNTFEEPFREYLRNPNFVGIYWSGAEEIVISAMNKLSESKPVVEITTDYWMLPNYI